MSTQLVFNSTQLSVINHNNQIFLTSKELAKALGYSKPTTVTDIYNRHSDEFTSKMTEILNLGSSGNLTKSVRIFSLRGCHLIAMFAKTAIAKEFRKWVLDVLDREVQKPIINTITPAQKSAIQKGVNQRVHRTGETHQAVYTKLHDHFKVGKYEELNQSQFESVLKWLGFKDSTSTMPAVATDQYMRSLENRILIIREHSAELLDLYCTYAIKELKTVNPEVASKIHLAMMRCYGESSPHYTKLEQEKYLLKGN